MGRPPAQAPEEDEPRPGSTIAGPHADEIRAIGSAIRARRKELGLPLRELSARTGLSVGFLSLVERGHSSMALTSLYAVARALESDIGRFFSERERPRALHPLPRVARAGEDGHTAIVSSSRTYKLLSERAPGKVLEPLLVTVHPTDAHEPFPHEGEEFCYVLHGELVYVVDEVEYRLGPGDSIHVQSTVPHAIHNETDEPVEAIWVLTPPIIR